jgi:hypothetical protein
MPVCHIGLIYQLWFLWLFLLQIFVFISVFYIIICVVKVVFIYLRFISFWPSCRCAIWCACVCVRVRYVAIHVNMAWESQKLLTDAVTSQPPVVLHLTLSKWLLGQPQHWSNLTSSYARQSYLYNFLFVIFKGCHCSCYTSYSFCRLLVTRKSVLSW